MTPPFTATQGMMVLALFLFFLGLGSAHGEKKDHGRTIVFTVPVRAVVFEHRKHLEQGLTCESCHPVLFATETGQVEKRNDFTMESFYQGKYCGACHNGRDAFAADTRCTLCHIGVTGHKRLESDYLEKNGLKANKTLKPE